MGARIFSVANIVIGLSFVAFALFQHNDPDPMYWMLFYGLGALACLLFLLKRLPPAAAAIYALLCCVLAGIWLTLTALGQPLPGESIGMAYESEKELAGFLVVGVWMAVLYFRAKAAGME